MKPHTLNPQFASDYLRQREAQIARDRFWLGFAAGAAAIMTVLLIGELLRWFYLGH